jgi:hypothetical protein
VYQSPEEIQREAAIGTTERVIMLLIRLLEEAAGIRVTGLTLTADADNGDRRALLLYHNTDTHALEAETRRQAARQAWKAVRREANEDQVLDGLLGQGPRT